MFVSRLVSFQIFRDMVMIDYKLREMLNWSSYVQKVKPDKSLRDFSPNVSDEFHVSARNSVKF